MTFIPVSENGVSALNSTNTPLAASGEYLGTSEDVARYSSITITSKSDVNSAPLGVKLEFSTDDTNWDIVEAYTYLNIVAYDTWSTKVVGKYFRVRYTNGTTLQTTFRIQTRFEVENKQDNVSFPIDAFNRIRVSDPYTLIANNAVNGKRPFQVFESITGLATSTHNSNESQIVMATTGTGSVVRRNRKRAIYQPGKSLLIYMTGILNDGTNASTVTTKIGYYDENDGYYFQFNNDVISIVERSSVSGSVVETTVNQTDWNSNRVDGLNNKNYNMDPSKALIYWFNLEWLGVGFVDCGIIVNGENVLVHRFIHSNTLSSPYIKTASLPPTYEIISTGGSGSMTSICQTAISEGGFNPLGLIYSANMGESTQSISSRAPLMVLRIKSGSLTQIAIKKISILSTSAANALVEVYRFVDTTAASILDDTTFISANAESNIEYNTAASTIAVTSGVLLSSIYFSNDADSINIEDDSENTSITVSNGVSDLIAICVTSLGPRENFIASVNWTESI